MQSAPFAENYAVEEENQINWHAPLPQRRIHERVGCVKKRIKRPKGGQMTLLFRTHKEAISCIL